MLLKYDCLSTQNCPDYYIIESTFWRWDVLSVQYHIVLKYTVECHARVVLRILFCNQFYNPWKLCENFFHHLTVPSFLKIQFPPYWRKIMPYFFYWLFLWLDGLRHQTENTFFTYPQGFPNYNLYLKYCNPQMVFLQDLAQSFPVIHRCGRNLKKQLHNLLW